MRATSQHILFIATEYAVGMRPYACRIIHDLWQQGDHVLIVAKDESLKQDFADIPPESLTWIDYPKQKLAKLLFRFYPTRLTQTIERLIEEHDIKLIYSLTEELVLAGSIHRLQRKCPVLYTVHDAIHHDIKFKTFEAWLRDRILMARPQRLMLKSTHHIITNSHEQLECIRQLYPRHDVHYAPFPSLVNEAIMTGKRCVTELEGITGKYILFFGNLLLYKGVHLLYDTYLNHPELQGLPLVIAGAGTLYFDLKPQPGRIIFINRFIDDEEIRDLFSRAATVVYPYISATQSGIVSIASYFGTKMVLSDLPFFVQTCGNFKGVEFFRNGDCKSMAKAISRSLQSSDSTREIYDAIYSPMAMQESINDILSKVLGQ